MTTTTSKQSSPMWILVLLCAINFLNTFDRGIIPGAPAQFQYFTQISKNSTDGGALIGALRSSFVATYAVCTPIFGYLSMTEKPFRLIAIGLSIWAIAVGMSSISKYYASFELLFVGQLLSGVGEASFQCIAQPFVFANAPSSMQSMWLGLYAVVATIGGVIGGIASATISQTEWGWETLFALEGLVIMPIMLICAFCIPEDFNKPSNAPATEESSYLLNNNVQQNEPTFMDSVWGILSNKVFFWLAMGVALTSFFSTGTDTMSTLMLIGTGTFESEIDVNVSLGIQGVLASAIGAVLGGVILDKFIGNDMDVRIYKCLRILVWGSLLMIIFCVVNLSVIPNKFWYIIWNDAGIVVGGAVSTIASAALLNSLEESQRPLATGIFQLLTRILGSVPGPIVMGKIKDLLAPHCQSIYVNGVVMIDPQCKQDTSGLLLGMYLAMVLLLVAQVCFTLAMFASKQILRKAVVPV